MKMYERSSFHLRTTVVALSISMFILGASSWSANAADVNAKDAEMLLKKSKCTTCHTVAKKKDGPPYQETAAKYRGKADAEETLFKHLTTNPKVKVDGKEEEHTSLKTKDEGAVRNVIRWILSR